MGVLYLGILLCVGAQVAERSRASFPRSYLGLEVHGYIPTMANLFVSRIWALRLLSVRQLSDRLFSDRTYPTLATAPTLT